MFRTTFIAITGSVGKTTTKDLIAATLAGMQAPLVSSIGSNNTAVEVYKTVLRVRPWHRFAVIEVATLRPGYLVRRARVVAPDIAVVLVVARAHTDNFPTLDDTAREKATLLKFVRRAGLAVLNGDDHRVARMRPPAGVRIITTGCGPDAQVRASSVNGHWPERLNFTVHAPDSGAERMQTQLVGTHWIPALLATVAVALECGATLAQALSQIERQPPTPGRMDPQMLPNGAVVMRDEFNGTIDTFQAAFDMLQSARAVRKILVFSGVTNSDESWTSRTRRIALSAIGTVDLLVLVGGLRNMKVAANAAIREGFRPEQIRVCENPERAAALLREELRAGDFVLLRGRMQDHLTRLYYAQLREVVCWKETCPKRILCEDCPELYATGEYTNRRVSPNSATGTATP